MVGEAVGIGSIRPFLRRRRKLGQSVENRDQDAASSSSEPAEHESANSFHWMAKAKMAFTKAEADDSAESWKEAVQSELSLLAVAQTLLIASEARLAANQTSQRAKLALEKATDAKERADRATTAANEAAHVAQDAVLAAIEAERTAEEATQALRDATDVAREAAEACHVAMQNVQDLLGIVARARATNSPDAWKEALRLASDAVGENQGNSHSRPTNEEAPVVETGVIDDDKVLLQRLPDHALSSPASANAATPSSQRPADRSPSLSNGVSVPSARDLSRPDPTCRTDGDSLATDLSSMIRRLAEMRDIERLSEDEFNRMSRELLGRETQS